MNKIEIQNRIKELFKKKDNPELFCKLFYDLIEFCRTNNQRWHKKAEQ
ncbi:MAG: hypothetical protein KAU01_00375 [Candidatus Cloacimonetes bacterium]|nr:hypothetical protein [Candidatus Cloacimonadota bacterium]